jgi:uncharacterized membrane protein YesL
VSRVDRGAVTAAPGVGRALRLAAEDLYYHGVRLVPANLLWGIGLLTTALALTQSPLGFALVIGMAPLTFGLMGMATIVVRDRTLVMSDFTRSIRTEFRPRLALAVAQLLLVAVAVVDLSVGFQIAGMLGLALVVVALYTLLATWVVAVVAWPLVMDPRREDESMRSRLRLAVILVVARPMQMAGLALVLGVLLVVSAILAAAIITFAAAYAALVAAHFVLPAAGRLQDRRTVSED